MILSTKAFTRVLDCVYPAVARKDLIEDLTCFWFDGNAVIAYNDNIGIKAPFTAGLAGGVKAATLRDFVKASRALLIEFEVLRGGKMVEFRAGEAKLTLELLARSTQIDFPVFEPSATTVVPAAFEAALPPMLMSVGADGSIPDQLGVTICPKGDDLYLFSTDANTFSATVVGRPEGWLEERFCIPKAFCEQVLVLCKRGYLTVINGQKVFAESEHKVQLWGRLVEVDRSINFDKLATEYFPADYRARCFSISKRFKRAIHVALALLDRREGDPVRISIDGEILRLYATASRNELIDAMWLEAPQPPISIYVNPILMRRAFDFCTDMLVTKGTVVMSGPSGFVHVISTIRQGPSRKV